MGRTDSTRVGARAGDRPDERAQSATTAVLVAEGLGGTRKLIDLARLGPALPLARRNGHVGRWASELVTGSTNEVVPTSGRYFGTAYRVANTVSHGAELMHAVIAVPNLIDGYRQDGWSGLLTTASGRTGLAQAAAATLWAGVAGGAAWRGRSTGVLKALTGAEELSSPAVVRALFGLNVATVSNEAGAFDGANRGNNESAQTILGRAARNAPRHVPLLFL